MIVSIKLPILACVSLDSNFDVSRFHMKLLRRHDDNFNFKIEASIKDHFKHLLMNPKNVSEFRGYYTTHIEPGNSLVQHTAQEILVNEPGIYSINQICSIYDYLRDSWDYRIDPRGSRNLMNYANESLSIGIVGNHSGIGDRDDFAILLASLIESIGGTTRIVFCASDTGGHSSAEVYLGKAEEKSSRLKDIVEWLRQRYNTREIYTTREMVSNDVWLNLDWDSNYLGGAFPPCKMRFIVSYDRVGKLVPVTASSYKLDKDYQTDNIELYKGLWPWRASTAANETSR